MITSPRESVGIAVDSAVPPVALNPIDQLYCLGIDFVTILNCMVPLGPSVLHHLMFVLLLGYMGMASLRRACERDIAGD